MLFAGACGSRTGLLAPEETDATPPDAKLDVKHDVIDASVIDVAEEDAPPPIDVVFPDVPVITDCPDAGSTLIYIIGAGNELYSFYPPTLTATLIGNVSCTNQSSPFSMAVNRQGIAYSVFSNGDLFQISTANAACKPTTYAPNQLGWSTFGMGYSTGADGGDELFVIEVDFNQPSLGLGTIDTNSFTLSDVGAFQPALTPECELTGTGDGKLFALCLSQQAWVDARANRSCDGEDHRRRFAADDRRRTEALAFAFWGGDFWIFTSPNSQTNVTRYDPVAKTETQVTTINAQIVGAGVSTCAPQ